MYVCIMYYMYASIYQNIICPTNIYNIYAFMYQVRRKYNLKNLYDTSAEPYNQSCLKERIKVETSHSLTSKYMTKLK